MSKMTNHEAILLQLAHSSFSKCVDLDPSCNTSRFMILGINLFQPLFTMFLMMVMVFSDCTHYLTTCPMSRLTFLAFLHF